MQRGLPRESFEQNEVDGYRTGRPRRNPAGPDLTFCKKVFAPLRGSGGSAGGPKLLRLPGRGVRLLNSRQVLMSSTPVVIPTATKTAGPLSRLQP